MMSQETISALDRLRDWATSGEPMYAGISEDIVVAVYRIAELENSLHVVSSWAQSIDGHAKTITNLAIRTLSVE